MLKFLKDWTLPVAMLVGGVGYPWFSRLTFLTPFLIFSMLLLIFCRVSPQELKLKRWHLWLLLIQLLGAVAIYLLLYRFDRVVAEGIMVCVICPTATAAAVITSKLGGNASSLVTYTLLANIGVAMAVPLFFPWIADQPGRDFWSTFVTILSQVFPLLICPILLAWLLRRFFRRAHHLLLNLHELAFYLWALSLVVVTAQTISSLVEHPTGGQTEIWIASGALIVCGLQFFLGKTLGGRYNDRISGGQALGQKNTILAIWMAHTYLHPLAAVGPGAYVLWQNIINSWQLWKRRRNESATTQSL